MTIRGMTKVTLSPLFHQRKAGLEGFLFLRGTPEDSSPVQITRWVHGGKADPRSCWEVNPQVKVRSSGGNQGQTQASHHQAFSQTQDVPGVKLWNQSRARHRPWPTQRSTLLQGSSSRSKDPHLGLNGAPGPLGRELRWRPRWGQSGPLRLVSAPWQ